MIEVRDEWLNKLFKRKVKQDDKRVAEIIEWIYQISGLKKPRVIFVESPLAIQYALNMMGSQVESQVRSQVWSQVESQVESRVGSQVGSQVWSQVGSQVRSQKLKWFDWSYYGRVDDYGWVGFYDYFRRIGILKNKNFDIFSEIFQYDIFSMVQLDGLCVICRLPEYVERDTETRMSSTTKSAIKWKDGYELYYINGVNFDKELWQKVIDKKLPAKKILQLQNIEQRYIALKLYGAENLLKELKAKQIDRSERGNELYELKNLVPNRSLKLLKYLCPSTKRQYVKFVPDEMTKADEAQAWSFSITPMEYSLLKTES